MDSFSFVVGYPGPFCLAAGFLGTSYWSPSPFSGLTVVPVPTCFLSSLCFMASVTPGPPGQPYLAASLTCWHTPMLPPFQKSTMTQIRPGTQGRLSRYEKDPSLDSYVLFCRDLWQAHTCMIFFLLLLSHCIMILGINFSLKNKQINTRPWYPY